jgi:hypothetical protein
MDGALVLAMILLLVVSGYVSGRVHGQYGYRMGYRLGYRQGFVDAGRGGPPPVRPAPPARDPGTRGGRGEAPVSILARHRARSRVASQDADG